MSPCQSSPDLWFSESADDIKAAQAACEECPLSRFTACRKEGWKHERGVFGGLSWRQRKLIDPLWYKTLTRANRQAATAKDKRIRLTAALTLKADGMTHEQIGQQVGMKKDAVEMMLRRAREAEAVSPKM